MRVRVCSESQKKGWVGERVTWGYAKTSDFGPEEKHKPPTVNSGDGEKRKKGNRKGPKANQKKIW